MGKLKVTMQQSDSHGSNPTLESLLHGAPAACAPKCQQVLLIQIKQPSQRGGTGVRDGARSYPVASDPTLPWPDALSSVWEAWHSGSWSWWLQLQEQRCFYLSPLSWDNHECRFLFYRGKMNVHPTNLVSVKLSFLAGSSFLFLRSTDH